MVVSKRFIKYSKITIFNSIHIAEKLEIRLFY